MGIVRANVTFSVVAKLVVLVAAVFGRANMWLAVFADTGVALLVILNGMRLLRGGGRSTCPACAAPRRSTVGYAGPRASISCLCISSAARHMPTIIKTV